MLFGSPLLLIVVGLPQLRTLSCLCLVEKTSEARRQDSASRVVRAVDNTHQIFANIRLPCKLCVVCRVECMMRAGELGPSSLCRTGVLPLLDVIAATTGNGLAVVEGGTVTCSDRCAQTRAQFRPD